MLKSADSHFFRPQLPRMILMAYLALLDALELVEQIHQSVAEQIMKVALDNNIPIMRNVELAHTLYYKGNINDYIPEDTYEAVAEILKWIAKLEEQKEEVSLEIFK